MAIILASSEGCCRKIGNKVKDVFVYNGLIRTVLETCIYILVGCFLNFKFGFAIESHSLLNMVLSALAIGLLFLFAYKCFRAI